VRGKGGAAAWLAFASTTSTPSSVEGLMRASTGLPPRYPISASAGVNCGQRTTRHSRRPRLPRAWWRELPQRCATDCAEPRSGVLIALLAPLQEASPWPTIAVRQGRVWQIFRERLLCRLRLSCGASAACGLAAALPVLLPHRQGTGDD